MAHDRKEVNPANENTTRFGNFSQLVWAIMLGERLWLEYV